MHTLTLTGGHTASVYLSAHEVPIKHYVEFQYYHMRDVGIGSSTADVERHFANLFARVGALANDPEQLGLVGDELALLHYNMNFMIERDHPSHLSFGALVAEVDGQPHTDLSEEGLTSLLARLADYGLTRGQVEDTVGAFLKKKPVN
ncbi:MAG: hypothetical protein ACRYG7_14980 [Janthinobacterium lividum]